MSHVSFANTRFPCSEFSTRPLSLIQSIKSTESIFPSIRKQNREFLEWKRFIYSHVVSWFQQMHSYPFWNRNGTSSGPMDTLDGSHSIDTVRKWEWNRWGHMDTRNAMRKALSWIRAYFAVEFVVPLSLRGRNTFFLRIVFRIIFTQILREKALREYASFYFYSHLQFKIKHRFLRARARRYRALGTWLAFYRVINSEKTSE